MSKKYISVAITIAISAVLALAFQNCGKSPLQAVSGSEEMYMGIDDDFDYEKQDCDNADSCLMTVTKKINTYPSVEYDFSPPNTITTMSKAGHVNDPLPRQFFRDNQNGSISKCVYNFERSKGRHDYICTREK